MALILPTNNRLGWKYLPRANALAYLWQASVTEKKMFYNIDTMCQCFKTFFICS